MFKSHILASRVHLVQKEKEGEEEGARGGTTTAKKSYYNRGTISPIVFWLPYRGEESRGGAFTGFMRQQ